MLQLRNVLLLAALVGSGACADDEDAGGTTGYYGGEWGSTGFYGTGSTGSGDWSGGGTGGVDPSTAGGGDISGTGGGIPPAEDEAIGDFNMPQASGRFVYAANENSDRLAVIDSETLRIDVVDVCRQPTVLRGLPQPGGAEGAGRVAVLCTGSHEVAIVHTNARGESTVELRPIVSAANALAPSPNGRHLVAYHDVDSTAITGAGSDQELTVIDTIDAVNDRSMSVGAHPRDVVFSQDGAMAYVVTADGVNVVDLLAAGPGRPRLIPVVDDTSIEPDRIEVLVSTAFVPAQAVTRISGEAAVTITNLVTAQRVTLPLSGYPTDLDIDGSGTAVYLTLPGFPDSQVLEVGLSAAGPTGMISHPIIGAYVGLAELSADGQTMLLYSSVNPWDKDQPSREDGGETGTETSGTTDDTGESTDSDGGMEDETGDDDETPPDPRERLTIARRGTGDWSQQTRLYTEVPIRGLGIAPNGGSAISLHEAAPRLNASAPWPYTLIDLASDFPAKKLQMVEAQPRSVMFTPDGARAALVVRDPLGQVRSAELINLQTFIVDSLQLGSPPLQTGYVASTDKIFITQEHEGGRMTFIGGGAQVQTVTGFELNDAIKD